METVCGIPAETTAGGRAALCPLARLDHLLGHGHRQHVHGTDNARCLIALALITGQIGRPGTGLHPLRGQNNVQGASDAGLIPMVYPDYQPVEKPRSGRSSRRSGADARSEARADRRRDHGRDPCREIGGMYIMGENPAMSDPDLDHAREALATLDHLVVQDLFLTETAFHADVILPASAFAEKAGTFTNTDRRVQMAGRFPRPATPGRICGSSRRSPEGSASPGTTPARRTCSPRWRNDALDEAHHVGASGARRRGDLSGRRAGRARQRDHLRHGFPTESGRAQIVPAAVSRPTRCPTRPYPMVLSTGRMLEHWHTGSMTRRAERPRRIEPEAVASLARGAWPGMRHRAGGFGSRRGAARWR